MIQRFPDKISRLKDRSLSNAPANDVQPSEGEMSDLKSAIARFGAELSNPELQYARVA